MTILFAIQAAMCTASSKKYVAKQCALSMVLAIS